MWWNEALTKDWNKPKEITAKEIAQALADTPKIYMAQLISKNSRLTDARRVTISKEAAKLAHKMMDRVEEEDKLISTAKALGRWFEPLGGALYDAGGLTVALTDIDADTVVSGGDMPTNIKTKISSEFANM